MACQSGYDVLPVKPFVQDFVEEQQSRSDVSRKDAIGQTEIIIVVEDVKIIDDCLIRDVSIRKARSLVEYREGVAHTAVGFLGNDVQSLRFRLDMFARSHILQMLDNIRYRDAREIINLATRQNRRQHLMFLRRCQNKQSMVWRLLQRLQESIEGGGTQHVHLIDNKNLVFSDGRRDAHLVNQRADIIDRVIRSRIQLVDIVRPLFVESLARFAFVASLTLSSRVQTINRLGKNTGTRSLTHAARTTKQIGVR